MNIPGTGERIALFTHGELMIFAPRGEETALDQVLRFISISRIQLARYPNPKDQSPLRFDFQGRTYAMFRFPGQSFVLTLGDQGLDWFAADLDQDQNRLDFMGLLEVEAGALRTVQVQNDLIRLGGGNWSVYTMMGDIDLTKYYIELNHEI